MDLVLWHINHCWLFKVKSSLYIQCNPDIRELSGPWNKSLISGLGLFCLGNTGPNLGPIENLSYIQVSLISGSLITELHCIY